MLGKLRAGLSQVGGSRVILATLAIAWGLNTIQKVVDEQSARLEALIQAEQDILNRAASRLATMAAETAQDESQDPFAAEFVSEAQESGQEA